VIKFGNNSIAASGIHFKSFSVIRNITLSNVTVIGASHFITSDQTRDLIHVEDDVKFYASHSCVKNVEDQTWKCTNPVALLKPTSSGTKVAADFIFVLFTFGLLINDVTKV
jgi:hypothetical protein